MNKKLVFISYLVFSVYMFSCSDGFKETPDGLKYRFIIHNADSVVPGLNDILVLNMKYTTMNDSVLSESQSIRLQLKEPSHKGGSVEEALSLMHKGDSAVFLVDAEGFFLFTRKLPLPGFMKPGDKLRFYFRLKDIIAYEDFQFQRKSIESQNQREENALLEDFLKRTNITVEPTASGMYIVEKKKGNGKKPTPGKKVMVHYLGYFVDGQLFDNSYQRNQPFIFTFGTGEVIPGWDEGISKLTEGSKAMFVIPSHLGYGDKQRGKIPPYSTLVFEIELLKVE